MDRTIGTLSSALFVLLLFSLLPAPPWVAAQQEGEAADQAMITMDFQEVELPVLIKFISELTGKNFIIDEQVKGKKVTIISPTKITKEEAYKVFESILDIKGLATVPAGKVIKIVPAKDAAEKSLTTIVGMQRAPDSDTMITRLVPLEYVDSSEMVKIFKPLMSRESKIDAYAPTNTLIMTDTSSNIARLLLILRQLDVESDEMIMEVIPLEYASAEVLARHLQEILETMSTPSLSTPTPSTPASRRSITSSRTTRRTSSASTQQAFVGRIIADDRTNSLIILTTQSQLQQIRELVLKLDYDTPRAYGNINVYYLEYSNAEDMAKVLNDLVSGARSTASAAGKAKTAPAPVQRTMASFEGEVSITADTATNSLIIVASPRDYQTLKNVIQKLDLRRKQVYVEAVFMEISPSFLQDIGLEFRGGVPLESGDEVDQVMIGGTNYNLGTNEMFQSLAALGSGVADTNTSLFPMDLGTTSGLTLGAIFDRITIPTTEGKEISIPANMFLIHALQRVTRTNILSTPHLIAIDNQESEIVVGQNVPFITSTSQSTVSTVQNVQRENVGITLRFTPQITEGDFIQLELYQEISALIESPIGQDVNRVGPTTSNRKAASVVLVRDGQTIIVGGLMEDRIRTVENKVPWLGDIPLLGWLFRYDTDTVEKNNLLIFLTPTIIREDQDVQELFHEQKRKMQRYKKRHKVQDKYLDADPFEERTPPDLPAEAPAEPAAPEEGGSLFVPDPLTPTITQPTEEEVQETALPEYSVNVDDSGPVVLPPATEKE